MAQGSLKGVIGDLEGYAGIYIYICIHMYIYIYMYVDG